MTSAKISILFYFPPFAIHATSFLLSAFWGTPSSVDVIYGGSLAIIAAESQSLRHQTPACIFQLPEGVHLRWVNLVPFVCFLGNPSSVDVIYGGPLAIIAAIRPPLAYSNCARAFHPWSTCPSVKVTTCDQV